MGSGESWTQGAGWGVAEGTGTAGEGTTRASRGQGWHGVWEELGGSRVWSRAGGWGVSCWAVGGQAENLAPVLLEEGGEGAHGPNAL